MSNSIKNKLSSLNPSTIILNHKKSFLIFSIIIIFEFVICFLLLNPELIQVISLFVGLGAITTSIFVAYINIESTKEIITKDSQRKIFFEFTNKIMSITNYNNKDNPDTIDKLNLKNFIESSSEPKEVSPTTFMLNMELTINKLIVRTLLNEYFIKLLNTPSDFFYLSNNLQKLIKNYTTTYNNLYKAQKELLMAVANKKLHKFENFEAYGSIHSNNRFDNPIGTKIITKNPYSSRNNKYGNFLIKYKFNIPENSDEYEEYSKPDFNANYYEVYILKTENPLVNKLGTIAIDIYMQVSEEIKEIL